MKKVLFVLAFITVYGVSLAMTETTVVSVDETIVVVDNVEKEKEEKDKKVKKDCTKTKECSGEKAAKSDCTKSCTDGKKTAEAKKNCSKSCDGKK